MARRRFFVPRIRRGIAELTGPEAEHLVRVLRAEPGQVYEISDSQNVYLAEVVTARKTLVSFQCLEPIVSAPPPVHVTLIAALFKFDRFEWLIEKATELGVDVIQPFEGSRTERGLAEASRKRITRWERIAVEASQQSRRAHLPEIRGTIDFQDSLNNSAPSRLLLDEEPGTQPIADCLPIQRTPEDQVALLLGPEGGWTAEERMQTKDAGWVPCSLGQNILRAETAGVAGLAVIQAAWATRKPD